MWQTRENTVKGKGPEHQWMKMGKKWNLEKIKQISQSPNILKYCTYILYLCCKSRLVYFLRYESKRPMSVWSWGTLWTKSGDVAKTQVFTVSLFFFVVVATASVQKDVVCITLWWWIVFLRDWNTSTTNYTAWRHSVGSVMLIKTP